jgi:O-antigen/teichoic acid export membrane protein
MITLSPLIIGTTLRDALVLILQSTNQITLLAAIEFLPSVFYLAALYSISKMTTINSGITLALQQASFLAAVFVIIFFLRPRIGSFRHYFQKIREENKKFGFPVYMGLLATYATSYINRLSISYWVDNTAIGFFSLAATISEPLKLIPNAAAISSFKSFAKQEKISRNIFLFTIISSSLALPAALLAIDPLLSWFYPKGFAAVGSMAKMLAVGAFAQGFGDFYNRFLGAHGKGKSLRNVAYLVGLVNIFGVMFLTPFFGINGAVFTTVLAGLANVTFMFITYRRFLDKS